MILDHGSIVEQSVNTDIIISIEPCGTRQYDMFDDNIYKTRALLTNRSWIIFPAPYDIVEKYLNDEVSFEEIKNYKIPKAEAPEELNEWLEIWELYDDRSIRALIKEGITTKTQLLNKTWSDIRHIKGFGPMKSKCLKSTLDQFGLSLKEE